MTAAVHGYYRLAGAALLWAGLALPPVRLALEAQMVLHMTVQIPLLAAAGAVCARALREREPGWLTDADRLGIPGILSAGFAAMFWMLPRSLDSSLASPIMESAKFVTLPLLVGAPLGLSWARLPTVGRGFVWANCLSMLGVVGWLYAATPLRVCSYYLRSQQDVVGRTLISLALSLAAVSLLAALLGARPSEERGTRPRHPPAGICNGSPSRLT